MILNKSFLKIILQINFYLLSHGISSVIYDIYDIYIYITYKYIIWDIIIWKKVKRCTLCVSYIYVCMIGDMYESMKER